jgi:3-methyl-2-oxobutanoate hydroxymethyltransferase
VATAISRELSIPTIGIGAGRGCDGQVLVYHDVLKYTADYRDKRFVKTYADIGAQIRQGISRICNGCQKSLVPGRRACFPRGPRRAGIAGNFVW